MAALKGNLLSPMSLRHPQCKSQWNLWISLLGSPVGSGRITGELEIMLNCQRRDYVTMRKRIAAPCYPFAIEQLAKVYVPRGQRRNVESLLFL